ncbi:WD40 repeat domain-containing protein [Streptomyces sp. NPDC085900]|uniref:WD40 repeat domain-containing protein n=1 Tax=Streptomyces sp. NPDC085900 TaxID=3365737 RepID=UPI0037CDA2E1
MKPFMKRSLTSVIRTGRAYGAWPVLAESDGELALLSFSDGASRVSRWDPRGGREAWQVDLRAGGGECAVAHSAGGGAVLAVASEDGVERLDVLTGTSLPSPHMEQVTTIWDVAAGLLPDGRSFFAGAGHVHQLVHRWDAATGEPLSAPLAGHMGCVMAVAVVPASDTGRAVIASGDEAGVILLWDAATGVRVGDPITGPGDAVRQIVPLRLSTGSDLIVCVDRDSLLWRWDAATGELLGAPVRLGSESEYPTLTAAVVDGASRLFVSGTGDDKVWEWDPVTGNAVDAVLPGISFAVLVRSDGAVVFAAGTREGDIALYA